MNSLPLTALAPMQDVTTLAFMQVIDRYGSPDYYFTEYFRVYQNSRLEAHILKSITENSTGKPIFAQMIGESIPDLVRAAQELEKYAIAGVDLNLGCPAPRVYRKNVGGGLLRDPERIEQIFAALRQAISGKFTVKMRIGFDGIEHFLQILELINRYQIDLLSLHGRTVKGGYHSEVRYDLIAEAVKMLNCPLLANGNISSIASTKSILAQTEAAGVMIGRNAIRNPWIFGQIRAHYQNIPLPIISLKDVYSYIHDLANLTCPKDLREKSKINHLKKYLNFIGLSVDREGNFLKEIRIVQTEKDFWRVGESYLLADSDRQFALEPYPGLIARPSAEVA
jgi:tRNA-dihydrouridine synthase B